MKGNGRTLKDRLRDGPLPVREALAVARSILEALEEMHRRDELHRCVNPASIVVSLDDPVTGASLVARDCPPIETFAEGLLETTPGLLGVARYLSPEQAGLIGEAVDHRSDLYATGVVLFECLAGHPPFDGTTLKEILSRQLRDRPPSLRARGLLVPRALDEVVRRLLRKDPRDRYQSASAALADCAAIAGGLAAGEADPEIAVGGRDRRRTLTDAAFIGRRDELARFALDFEGARSGVGCLFFLEGESGGGKTALLDEMACWSAQQGAWVLRGHGTDQAAQRPFQVLDGVVRQVREAAGDDPGLAHRLRHALEHERGAVSAALPAMAEVLDAAPPCALPEAFGEARSLDALTALLDALGTPERPAVVLIDDCQWADELAVKLFARWRREAWARGGPARHILLVASFRSEEVSATHSLRAILPSTHLLLRPLERDDLRRLAESMAGPLPEEAIEIVEHLSEGSPFMASAVLLGLVESAALVGETGGWRVQRSALAKISSSRWAAAYLTGRLKVLPETELRLLLGGAVLGKEFELPLAARLASLSSTEAASAIEEARRRHIVWRENEGWAFVHDKIRESLLALLGDGQRSALHLAAALMLEELVPRREMTPHLNFDLAYHFDAAGQPERALPFALAAARQARAQFALEVASRQYRIAERGARSLDAATRRRVAEGLGEVEMLRGHYDEAEAQLQRARALADSDLGRATIEGQLGELAFKRGEVKAASIWIEHALRLLGERVPRHVATFWILLLWEMAIQTCHSWFPRLFLARRGVAAESRLLAIRLYSRLAYAFWFGRGKVPCGWAHLREMNLAERYPPGPELAQAWSEHAPVCTMLPYFRRGITYAERSLAIRRALGDVWGQGQSLHFYGVVLYGASRFAECIDKCQEAVRFLERTGDRWEVNTARWHIAYALYRLGRLEEAVAVARDVHRAGISIGDHQASGISLSVWSKATGGRAPAELVRAELERPSDDLHTGAEVAQAEAIRLLTVGDAARAAKLLEEAWQRVKSRGLRQEYVSPILPWWARALRHQAEEASSWDPRRRRTLLRRARAVARSGIALARWYRNNLPMALRERALIEAMLDRPRRARSLLRRSLSVAQRQGARLECALTLASLGRLGRDLGWPSAEAQLAAGEHELQVLRADGGAPPVTLSLMDRFAGVIDLGRRIASALTPQAVYAAVHDAAIELLRSQRAVVIGLGQDGGSAPGPVAGDRALPCRVRLLHRAIAAGGPIVFDRSVEATELDDELVLAEAKSAMCAPIFVRGRPAACLFVTHGFIERLFREEERRLALFITTLAGAALENAAGFAESAALSRSLEQRVAQRTAELEAAKEHSELARSLLEASLQATADGILVVDRKGRIEQFNDQFARMWRIPPAILSAGDDARAIAHVQAQLKDAGAFYSKVQDLYSRPEVESEDVLEFKDGRAFARSSKPQRLGGVCIGRVWSFRDITAQKGLEQQLRRSKEELEEQFHRAQTASRMKSDFLANMSHELRTPLNSIIGFAELIHDGRVGPVSAPHREYLEDILTSARHLLQLINDVLDLARVEAGKLQLRPERVDLPALVGEVHDVLRALAVQRRMRIETSIDRALDDVVTDPAKLKQILYNYLSNALKFAIGECVFVRLRAVGDEEFSVEVEDEGPGISAEDIGSLFVEFQQLDASASKRHGGTGLGLALTKQLVEAQGGRVGVKSELGRGSVFFAILPRQANGAAAETHRAAPSESSHAA